jgi:predicted acylesterase/phospholipase RssA
MFKVMRANSDWRLAMNLTKEIRIALVLYGGVSLAVYMNGVANELLALTRARRGASSDADGNAYTSLLERMNSEVVIDIISGNSAGGINGVLLAKSLAIGADLSIAKKFWRDSADLKNMLNPEGKPTDTLLNGNFMLRRLNDYFKELTDSASMNPKVAEERKSKIHILDLFVSASDIRGRRWNILDSNKNEIEGLTHGVIFHRKYRTAYGEDLGRGYWQNDFEGAVNDDMLARISRATSAMPALFPEQKFEMKEVYGGTTKYDKRKDVYLHDGLLTDNKPFDPVLDTIFNRSADRNVDRWLLFLDPIPCDTHFDETVDHYLLKPDLMEALESYISIPRYQSIYRQIRAIEEYRARVESITGVLDLIDQSSDEDRDYASQPSFLPYCRLRAEQWQLTFLASVERYLDSLSPSPNSPSKQQVMDFVKDALQSTKLAPQLMERIQTLEIPDVEFFCRYFHFHIQKINQKLSTIEMEDEIATVLLLHKEALWAAVENVRNLQWKWWNSEQGEDKCDYRLLRDTLSHLAELIDPSQSLATIMEFMTNSIFQSLEKFPYKEMLSSALQLESQDLIVQKLQESMKRFIGVDMFMYPLVLGHEGELSKLELIRINPSDATTLGLTGSSKLVGNDLGAFAGFLDERWRSNDLMWGRLDTADILISYMDESHSKTLTDEEKKTWKQFVAKVRADRFDAIIREEIQHTDEKLYQGYLSLDLSGSPEERLQKMASFFNSPYKVGLQTWLNLPFIVKLKRGVEAMANFHSALYRHYRNRLLGKVTLGSLNLFWQSARFVVGLFARDK